MASLKPKDTQRDIFRYQQVVAKHQIVKCKNCWRDLTMRNFLDLCRIIDNKFYGRERATKIYLAQCDKTDTCSCHRPDVVKKNLG